MEAIFAIDDGLGFGQANRLPWPTIKEDMDHFVQQTKNKTLIMGKRTFKSLPIKATEQRPFHVLSRLNHKDSTPHLTYSSSLPNDGIIIGGASLFNHTLFLEKCSRVYVTRVKGVFKADTKIQQESLDFLEAHFQKVLLQSTDKCTIWVYFK